LDRVRAMQIVKKKSVDELRARLRDFHASVCGTKHELWQSLVRREARREAKAERQERRWLQLRTSQLASQQGQPEAPSREEQVDRTRELQRWIEIEFMRQRWESEYGISEELEREVRNQRWREHLDREIEEMRVADEEARIEAHFVRFVEPFVEQTL